MRSSVLLLGILSVVLLAPGVVSADDVGSHTATAIGARMTYYRPYDADFGKWSPGVQLRLHGDKTYALECSADFTHTTFGGTRVSVIPVQATILGFLYPESSISPYVLLGGGWYFTRVQDPSPRTVSRFGPHAGAGLQLLVNDGWSLDGSYRFLWTQSLHLQDPTHPLGQNFSSKGYMITVGLNYRF